MAIFSISCSRDNSVWVLRVCKSPSAVSAQLLPPLGASRCVGRLCRQGRHSLGALWSEDILSRTSPTGTCCKTTTCIPSLYTPSEKAAFTPTTEGIITPINNKKASLSHCLSYNCLKAQYKHLPIKPPHSPHSQVNMF